ncbi:hypothetical protein CLAFUW4_10054 [Fulvia fulva]|uniref:Uncharacterized protein n=1 Tax=Passalora fulva TaxID=5499 RepID=A0A9Q8UUJ7_PASFU|nr:uncharacterized protein CLAFUR5_12190 [Fulvia fulva]KAK4615576.1 hypothetical protein CLAFUR4_10058 [Fulvia fulva]KAK4616414.1 hypothetical protein CLAFUR0_10056 [Fulvia fulva]UJO22872.1 hypothetical protein CLAFUR5_12190 [Fulvia fulva]WPV19399.1 hypothetical protein CLAFUW4_10054 [Fulvia fulva]WPV34138.1 hypothetical protein CLAFUW7_10055 [Fulvia fulva]
MSLDLLSIEYWQRRAKRDFQQQPEQLNVTCGMIKTAILRLLPLAALVASTALTVHLKSTHTVTDQCSEDSLEVGIKHFKFDQLLYAWVPEDCFYENLHDQYVAEAANTTWFRYNTFSTTVEPTVVEHGQIQEIYASQEWQSAQCVYLWEMFGTSVETTRKVVEWAVDVSHSTDCAKRFLDYFDTGLEPDSSHWFLQKVQYLRCRRLS